MRHALMGTVTVLWLTQACGMPPENADVATAAGQSTSAIINGEACTEADFESTVAVMVDATLTISTFTQPMKTVFCTGTLIAPDVVLTAAHCLDPSVLSGGFGTVSDATFYVTRTADLGALAQQQSTTFPPDTIMVADSIKNPGFSIDQFNTVNGPGQFHDVGLLFLSAPMAARPARLATEAETTQWMTQNQEIEIVGWGLQQPASSNPLQPPPAGTVGFKRCALSFINEVGTAEFQVGAGANTSRKCHGDSGGPSYVLVEGDLPRVVGITSHAYDQSDCAKGGVDTRVDTWRAWIDEQMTLRCTQGTRIWCGVPGVPPAGYVFPTVVVTGDGGTIVVEPTPDAGTNGGGGGSGGDSASAPKRGCNSQSTPQGFAWGVALLALSFRRR